MRSLRLLNSDTISYTHSCELLSASSAAYCDIDDAQVTECCCIFNIVFTISTGATAYPTRHPVIAYVFENPFMIIVRSDIASSDAMLTCFFSYIIFS